METNTENMSLEMLRDQVAAFKERLDKQEIINDRLIRQAMKSHVSWVKNMNTWVSVVGLLFLPLIIFAQNSIHASWLNITFISVMMIGEIIFNFYNVHTINDKLMSEGDIVTVRQKLLAYKRREKMQIMIETPLLIIWVIWFILDIYNSGKDPYFLGGAVGAIIGGIIGIGIMGFLFSREMRSLNRAIHVGDDFSNEQP